MKYTPKSNLLTALNDAKVVNRYKDHTLSVEIYVCEGRLYKKLVCKSSTCKAHDKAYRELKLQRVIKNRNKGGETVSYEYQYYNVKDTDNRIINISPAKLDLLTFVNPTNPTEQTLAEIIATPD
jgi:hypothetical protein